MIVLTAKVEVGADGAEKIVYNWIMQSKHHFIIRIINKENYHRLMNRYSGWMTKNVLDPEILSVSRSGNAVVILETEFY